MSPTPLESAVAMWQRSTDSSKSLTRPSDKTHIMAVSTIPEAVDTKQKMQFSDAATNSFGQNYILGKTYPSIFSCVLYVSTREEMQKYVQI